MTTVTKRNREDARAARVDGGGGTTWVVRAILLVSLGLGAGPVQAADDLTPALPLDYALRSLEGEAIRVESLRGGVTVVNFWASWCKPCRTELPLLDRWHARLAAEGGRVIAVSIDNDVENARRFVRQAKLTMPVFHDGPEGLARLLDLPYLPCTLVLDEAGRTVGMRRGGKEGDLAELERIVASLLADGAEVSARSGGGRDD